MSKRAFIDLSVDSDDEISAPLKIKKEAVVAEQELARARAVLKNGGSGGQLARFDKIKLESDRLERVEAAQRAQSIAQAHTQAFNASGSGNRGNSRRFYGGEVLPTSNNHGPSLGESLSFDQILQPKSELKTALISSYVIEDNYVNRHFQSDVEVIFLRQSRKAAGDGTLLVFKSFMRVVITSANAMELDYVHVDNMMYIHDFPLLPSTTSISSSAQKNPTHSPLLSLPLLVFFDQFGVVQQFKSIEEAFKRHDFSSSNREDSARLVVSNQGTFQRVESFGEGGGIDNLARAVKSCNFNMNGKWNFEFSTSSVGQPSDEWIIQMIAACHGISPQDYFTAKSSIPSSFSLSDISKAKIVYPTMNEIDDSILGRAGAGTLYCSSKTWESENFRKELFHHAYGKRSGVIAHSKTTLGINSDNNEGFVYVGSHNFSGAAWGKLEVTKTKSIPKMHISNYELGVVIPHKRSSNVDGVLNRAVSYRRPLVTYDLAKDTPWNQYGKS